jgi:hypothetical protein
LIHSLRCFTFPFSRLNQTESLQFLFNVAVYISFEGSPLFPNFVKKFCYLIVYHIKTFALVIELCHYLFLLRALIWSNKTDDVVNKWATLSGSNIRYIKRGIVKIEKRERQIYTCNMFIHIIILSSFRLLYFWCVFGCYYFALFGWLLIHYHDVVNMHFPVITCSNLRVKLAHN